MIYRERLEEYFKTRRKDINTILTINHKMSIEKMEQIYKNTNYAEFYNEVPQEEIAQENDYHEYIKLLLRWKW